MYTVRVHARPYQQKFCRFGGFDKSDASIVLDTASVIIVLQLRAADEALAGQQGQGQPQGYQEEVEAPCARAAERFRRTCGFNYEHDE